MIAVVEISPISLGGDNLISSNHPICVVPFCHLFDTGTGHLLLPFV